MINDFVAGSLFFGMVISLLAYIAGLKIRQLFNFAILNPLLLAIVFVILFLSIFKIDYDTYYNSAKYLSYLLTPSTVCLAIPLYQQIELLRKHARAIIAGVIAGMLTSMISVFALAKLLKMNHEQYVTLLPKSITSAIGMGVSEQLGGIVAITVVVIIVSGIVGNLSSGILFKLFRINDPVACGLALGSSSHAIGTVKAFELGEIEGAMSSLAIAASGIVTVIVAPFFARLA
jgi:predicted murein hydrolase (TIGR00659 family)